MLLWLTPAHRCCSQARQTSGTPQGAAVGAPPVGSPVTLKRARDPAPGPVLLCHRNLMLISAPDPSVLFVVRLTAGARPKSSDPQAADPPADRVASAGARDHPAAGIVSPGIRLLTSTVGVTSGTVTMRCASGRR